MPRKVYETILKWWSAIQPQHKRSAKFDRDSDDTKKLHMMQLTPHFHIYSYKSHLLVLYRQ